VQRRLAINDNAFPEPLLVGKGADGVLTYRSVTLAQDGGTLEAGPQTTQLSKKATRLTVFRTALAVALGIAMPTSIAMAFCSAYHTIRAAYCRRTDAPFRWIVALNRINAVLFADQLNEVGLQHRSEAFKYQIRAIVCWVVGAVLVLILFLTR
jgi:hypothetical protein